MADETAGSGDPLHRLLSLLVRESPNPTVIKGPEDWWRVHHALTERCASPFHHAVLGGFSADRLGWAFASGYQGALRVLLPSYEPDAKVVLAATESEGNHPKNIRSQLTLQNQGWRLDGAKEWITLGSLADVMLVAASEGKHDDGRNRIAVVRVPRQRQGVHVEKLPTPPFAPEVPHARVRFEGTPVEATERLPGDGYSDYVKPFRTIEDVYVHGALLGWLIQIARRAGWSEAHLQELFALLTAAHGLSRASAASPVIHVALAGLLEATERFLTRAGHYRLWEQVDETTRARWERDRALLDVAAKARERRIRTAWNRVRMTH
ncbi:MAG: acyl-CoA dehydrogenase family protein [Polyangiales bacterium]